MPIAASFARVISAIAPNPPQSAGTGAEILTTFLGSDALLWGCLALGLIALFTLSRIVSRRRSDRRIGRRMRASSQATHAFIEAVRKEHPEALKGIWHYDFGTRSEQMSDDLKRLVTGKQNTLPYDTEVNILLKEVGLDLVTLAREHREETEPYTVEFTLPSAEGLSRPMVLQACNIKGREGSVQRMLAIIREASS